MPTLNESTAAFERVRREVFDLIDRIAKFGTAGMIKSEITDDMIQQVSDAALEAAEQEREKPK